MFVNKQLYKNKETKRRPIENQAKGKLCITHMTTIIQIGIVSKGTDNFTPFKRRGISDS